MVKPHAGFNVSIFRQPALKGYFSRMSKDRNKVLVDDHVNEVLRRQGYTVDDDPRSIYSVEKLFQALHKYSPENATVPIQDEFLNSGISLAYACFSKPIDIQALRPMDLTFESIDELTSSKKASAGLTAYGLTKAESVVRAYERAVQTLLNIKGPEPCLAFARTQFGNKTRLVWGYPYSMTAIEGLFARPLIKELRKGTTPMSLFMTKLVIGSNLRRSSYRHNYCYSIDMSSFDASISARLINIAFDIISTWFDLDHAISNETSDIFDSRKVFALIRKYFTTSPIVMPDGNIYKGRRHGVPSGSYFTQIVDSIVNVIICGAISHKFNLSVDKTDIMVLGDDMVFWSNTQVNLNTMAKFANEQFKVTFNASKSQFARWDEPIHYLGKIWTHGVPDLPINEIVKRLKHPERFRKYSKDKFELQSQVAYLILCYVTEYYSAWKLMVDILVKGDKPMLDQMSPDEIERYVKQLRHYTRDNPELIGCMPNQKFDSTHLSGLLAFKLSHFPQFMEMDDYDRKRMLVDTCFALGLCA